jgi:nitrite reductase (NO-forming)
VAAVALGALGVAAGYATAVLPLAVSGGIAYMAGMALTGFATLAPARHGLGPRGGVITLGYLLALLMVLTGALVGSLFMAGWQPVLETWASLKPAHAVLNLVGFVSLVIATTLLHFFPTVIGARILRTPNAYVTVVGLASGAALLSGGFALRSDGLVRGGATAVAIGAVALAAYAWQAWRTRALWTGDRGWHLYAMGGLVSAIAWFEVGVLMTSARLLVSGADPAATNADILAGPLVVGWVALAVLASATHLVPAIGPGDPAAHARQRRLLGQGAALRLAAANVGIAGISVGLPLHLDWLTLTAMLLAGGSLFATAALLVAATVSGLRSARASGNLVE